ncbi:MAG: lipoyl(octanoyl) transferase LipB [Gemmatimonadales bacterium]
MSAALAVLRLGHVAYQDAHELQRRLADQRQQGIIDRDMLLLLEHEPTITLGRGTRPESLPIAVEELKLRGLTVAEVDRGGDVTWHGPGQLVGYPILDLTRHRQDLHWYLRQVEAALIDALVRLQLPAERNPGKTGVWTRGRKIASVGIHVRQWVTTHGFALNVSNDLDDFGLIVPCGIPGVTMTTVERELGRGESTELWDTTLDAVVAGVAKVFSLTPEPTTLAELPSEGTGVHPGAF